MRSGEICISAWVGSDQKLRFSRVGAAEGSRGWAALENRRASVPIDVDARSFGVQCDCKLSTHVYANPQVNVFAARHFLVSNVAQ